MRFITQLLVSLIAAGAATAAIFYLQLSGLVQLGITIAIATCTVSAIAALLHGNAGTGVEAGEEYGDREEGEVKWFNVSKGFGFIRRDNGEEIFVHFRSIRDKGQGRRALKDGQRVLFSVVDSDKGPQAEDVEAL